jgi:hypothetical protein
LKNALSLFGCFLLFVAMTLGVQAAESRSSKLNQGAVGLLASQPDLIDDALLIADALDHTKGLRILPIVGRGGLQSINDLLFLRGIDVAMIASDSTPPKLTRFPIWPSLPTSMSSSWRARNLPILKAWRASGLQPAGLTAMSSWPPILFLEASA